MPLKGSCHCGATRFAVPQGPERVFSCTCSFCAKRGGLWAYYEPADFELTTARDRVSTYQWRSYLVQHHHCAFCGCGTYSGSPVFENNAPVPGRTRVGVNARLFDDFDLEAIPITVMDGKTLW